MKKNEREAKRAAAIKAAQDAAQKRAAPAKVVDLVQRVPLREKQHYWDSVPMVAVTRKAKKLASRSGITPTEAARLLSRLDGFMWTERCLDKHIRSHCPHDFLGKVDVVIYYEFQRVGKLCLFHGTRPHVAGLISKDLEMKPGTEGLFGPAIYGAPSFNKAYNYIGWTNGVGFVITINANPGSWVTANSHGDYSASYDAVYAPRGKAIDGVWGGSLANDEWAFYRPEQVVVQGITIVKKRGY